MLWLQHPARRFFAGVLRLLQCPAGRRYARAMSKKPAEKPNPARIVLQAFAERDVSIRAIARELDIEPSTVSRWPERNKGAGDIPSRYHRPLLDLAAKRGALVTADVLVTGRW